MTEERKPTSVHDDEAFTSTNAFWWEDLVIEAMQEPKPEVKPETEK